MSVKDFDISENIEREQNQKTGEDWKTHHTPANAKPENSGQEPKTEVKNAHATGDGSYGRNDGSIPENDEKENMRDNIY
jgi:hypothetical protein